MATLPNKFSLPLALATAHGDTGGRRRISSASFMLPCSHASKLPWLFCKIQWKRRINNSGKMERCLLLWNTIRSKSLHTHSLQLYELYSCTVKHIEKNNKKSPKNRRLSSKLFNVIHRLELKFKISATRLQQTSTHKRNVFACGGLSFQSPTLQDALIL